MFGPLDTGNTMQCNCRLEPVIYVIMHIVMAKHTSIFGKCNTDTFFFENV